MAQFSKLVVTEKGNALIAKALANTAAIKFTKVSSSAATYELSELEGLESFTDIRQTHLKPKVQRINNTSVEVKAAFNNTELTNGYYIRAFGLYADDPDEGEILYGAAVETSGNCYMPAYNGVTSSGVYLRIVTTVGNSQNVSLEIDPAAVATLGDIEEIREKFEVVVFDDSGEVEGIESFEDFMASFIKETSIYKLFANLKAGLKYVLHAGKLVNSGMCETPGAFALDAAYGKTLTDQVSGLYSDIYISESKEIINISSINNNNVSVNIPEDGIYNFYCSIKGHNTENDSGFEIHNSEGRRCALYIYPVTDDFTHNLSGVGIPLKSGSYKIWTLITSMKITKVIVCKME